MGRLANLQKLSDLLRGWRFEVLHTDVGDLEALHWSCRGRGLWGKADQVGDPLAHQGLHLALGGGNRGARQLLFIHPGEVPWQMYSSQH